MKSHELREKIKQNKLYIWQVAMECGVSEAQFYRWLRDPISEEHEKKISMAIESLLI